MPDRSLKDGRRLPDAFIRWGGEFAEPMVEARFRADRLDETVRHARILFALSIVLNTLFLASDWRFYGTDHFWIAVPARLGVIGISALCCVLMLLPHSFRSAQAVMVGWMWGVGAMIAFLVSSHSDIAFLVVLLLPAVFYLAVPAGFIATVVSGAACSVAMFVGYFALVPWPPTALGLAFVLLVLNVALYIVVSRSNRLWRLSWSAAQTERALREELADSRLLIESMFMAVPTPLAVVNARDGRAIRLNQAAAAFFGEDLGSGGATSVGTVYEPEILRQLAARAADDPQLAGFETNLTRADGRRCEALIMTSAIEIGGEPCLITSLVDISRQKEIETNLQRLASTDPLTGLANRSRFFAVAALEIARAAAKKMPVSILMADLDDFKRTNDRFGHEAGDMALKAFAEVCTRTLRGSDVVARLGGEEFAIMMPGADEASAMTLAELIRIETENLRFASSASSMRLSVSIGVAEIAEDEDTDQALARADRALYAAKNSGRNRVVGARSLEATGLSIVA